MLTENEKPRALRTIRLLISLFILGLVISGLTAIPLETELNLLAGLFPLRDANEGSAYMTFAGWIHLVREGVRETNARYPFLAYGTDWLAFGHLAIAVAFLGPLRDPVRNLWVLTFGLIACAAVIPYALVFGALREIPWWWRIIDCSFGAIGFPLLWYARRLTKRLEQGAVQER